MLGAWPVNETPIYRGMHNQPGRLVRGRVLAPWGPNADRMTNLEGLGNLAALGAEESWSTDESEEASAEKDTDWMALVAALAKPVASIGVEVAKGLFMQSKQAQGVPMTQIMSMLGLADQRAAAVKAGTANMPTAGWIGIGVGAVAVVGLILFLAMRR